MRWPRAAVLVWIAGLALPAWAAAPGEAHPRFGPVLFGLAVLLLAAKLGGLLATRAGQPAVLGELLVGIGLGNLLPTLLGGQGLAFVRGDPTLRVLAEVGVLLLLFDVGLEADLRALARVGPSSLLVALIGVTVPLGLGWGAAAWLLPGQSPLVHVFVGATLTATSVGITVRVLADLEMTRASEGQIILGAALLDDVLGLVVLAVVSGAVTAAASGAGRVSVLAAGAVLLRAALFLGVAVGIGHLLSGPLVRLAARTREPGMLLIAGLALCFTLAFVAEQVGLADIVGAFAAGLMLDPYGTGVRAREEETSLSELLHPLSRVFVPLFFVLTGAQVSVESLADLQVLGLGAVLTACAIAGKLASGLGVLGGASRLVVGIGMIPRGEVGLIFAGIGSTLTLGGAPVLSQEAFSAVVLMVMLTTLVTPVALRRAVRGRTPRGGGQGGAAAAGRSR